jgi:transposase
MATKRKRVVLTIDEKVEILQLLETSSRTAIANKFGVGKTTITDIKAEQRQDLGIQEEIDGHGNDKASKDNESSKRRGNYAIRHC